MLDINYLEECFTLDTENGTLTWNERPLEHFDTERAWKSFNKRFAGKQAGSAHVGGYRKVLVDGKRHLVHRIIYFMATGELPEMLDHINGDGSDNRLSNLRPATNAQNQANSRIRKDNKTGFKGVSVHASGKFVSYLVRNGKQKHLGLFQTPEAAHAAYIDAMTAVHGEYARAA